MKIAQKLTKPSALICIFAIVLSAFAGCKKDNIIVESDAFGVNFSAEFFSQDDVAVLDFFSVMEEAVKETEAEFSLTDESSPLYTLNDTGLLYSTDFFKRTLKDVLLTCTVLDDSVDITVGKVAKLWGFYSGTPKVPDSKKLQKAVKAISLDKINIAENSNKITIEKDIEIDMSAVSRGIALDRAYEKTALCKIPYMLTFGDTVMAYGEGPAGGKWEIGIKNPFTGTSENLATIKLSTFEATDTFFVSTSGSNENKFEENGKTYHSILDPQTGYPVENDIVSVTVIAESGLTAQALSKALFINGFSEKSFSYLEYFSGEAVFVFSDKTYYVTEGLKDSLEITDSSFTARTEITN